MLHLLKQYCSHRYFIVFLSAISGIALIVGFSIPIFCIFKKISGIPCPGCGLTRAFLYLASFRFIEAVKQNILVMPFVLSALAGIICFLADRFFGKNWLPSLHSALTSKVAIKLAIILMISSWAYNITMGN